MIALGKHGVEAAIERVVAGWAGQDAPDVVVVGSVLDLPMRLLTFVDTGVGTFDPETSTVYLIGDRIFGPKHARRALAREVINHYSLMQILGGDFDFHVADVIRLIETGDRRVNEIAADVRATHGIDVPEDVLAVHTLGGMAEQGVPRPPLHRSITSLRRFLRSQGLRLSYSYPEARSMIARAASNL